MFLEILLIAFAFFLCVVLYILFAPLLLEINTRSNLYRFSIVPVFRIWWVIENFPGHFEMSILGFRKKMFQKKERKEKIVLEIQNKKHKPSKYKMNFRRIISVIRSFKIKKCLINFDTGDMPLNGELFPLMNTLSSMTGKNIHVNFFGKNEVAITIKNNAFRMLRAFIMYY